MVPECIMGRRGSPPFWPCHPSGGYSEFEGLQIPKTTLSRLSGRVASTLVLDTTEHLQGSG